MADLFGMLQAAAGQAGEATDPNFNQTVLLLHGDGTNGAQNNTFLDSSTNNFTITRNGNTTQGTFSPFSLAAGEFSNFFDGSGDFLSFANGTFNLSNNDFVVEAFFYLSDYTGFKTIAGGNTDLATANGSSWNITIVNSTGTLDATVYIGATVYQINVSTAVPLNSWNHIAFVRTGGRISLYLNGTREDTDNTLSTGSVNNGSTNNPPCIAANGGANQFKDYLSNVRIIIGANASNAYDANSTSITVPTAPLTAVTDTTVVTCQSNRFVDNSSSPKTITVNGNPSVQPFSPFLPTAEYDASVNGGSGYFDGTDDYLWPSSTSADLAMGSGDFTVEFWIYTPRGATRQYIFDFRANAAGGAISPSTAFALIWGDNGADSNGNELRYISLVSGIIASDADLLGITLSDIADQWNHIAIVRSSGTVYGYLNGVRKNSVADSTNFNVNCSVAIGAAFNGSVNLLGNISNFRVVKGTAVYTGTTYTVPTAPLTAVSGTELLCNFTNAGIFDNTGKNNLETVGNAQIDTTTKKYGTGSMEFDGTGDWLLLANNVNQQLGTGNFTIEFWVYLATGDTGSNRGLVAKGTSTTGFLVSLNTTQKVVFTFATSTITSSGAITLDAWNHIAVVREGTGSNQTKIYIAGTNDGTGTVSTDFNQTSVMYVGANRTGGDPMKGFIDDLRITKGVARYTANFSVPTEAFPDL
jgi:hypothetical protein